MRGVEESDQSVANGLLKVGDVTISTLPDELPISTGDYVLLALRKLRETQTFAHTGSTDRLRHYAVRSVIEIRDLDTIYVQGTDYALSTPAALQPCLIEWLEGGNQPALGATVAALYWRSPLYEIRTDVGIARREIHGVPLPQRVGGILKNPDWRF